MRLVRVISFPSNWPTLKLHFLQKGGAKSDGEKKSGGGDAATVVMKMDIHCDGCAKKVKKLVNGFNGTFEFLLAKFKTKNLPFLPFFARLRCLVRSLDRKRNDFWYMPSYHGKHNVEFSDWLSGDVRRCECRG